MAFPNGGLFGSQSLGTVTGISYMLVILRIIGIARFTSPKRSGDLYGIHFKQVSCAWDPRAAELVHIILLKGLFRTATSPSSQRTF